MNVIPRPWIPGRGKWIAAIILLLVLLPTTLYPAQHDRITRHSFSKRHGFLSNSGVKLLTDSTAYDPTANEVIEQQIFDHMLAMIRSAQHVLVLDLFLWNAWQGAKPELHRNLSTQNWPTP